MELKALKSQIGNTKLVAVSKSQSDEAVFYLYQQGQRIFAENKAKNLERRYHTFPKDVEWHFIGHLQTNKIKTVVPYASLIHSVDSEKLLFAIDNFCYVNKMKTNIDVLLQLKISQESTKYGFAEYDLHKLLTRIQSDPLHCVKIIGLMGMATHTSDETLIRNEFRELFKVFEKLKKLYFINDGNGFRHLSMGMSSDYNIAIQEGSTMVRIGSLLYD